MFAVAHENQNAIQNVHRPNSPGFFGWVWWDTVYPVKPVCLDARQTVKQDWDVTGVPCYYTVVVLQYIHLV